MKKTKPETYVRCVWKALRCGVDQNGKGFKKGNLMQAQRKMHDHVHASYTGKNATHTHTHPY